MLTPPQNQSLIRALIVLCSLYNIHTGETVKVTFWSQGQFIDSEIEMIDMLVRDFRANDVMAMDRKLYQDLV